MGRKHITATVRPSTYDAVAKYQADPKNLIEGEAPFLSTVIDSALREHCREYLPK